MDDIHVMVFVRFKPTVKIVSDILPYYEIVWHNDSCVLEIMKETEYIGIRSALLCGFNSDLMEIQLIKKKR